MAKGPRDVVDARADKVGNIEAVRLEGNQRFTSLETAISMAEDGKIGNAHAVRPQNAKPHLRSNPDAKTKNNLDEMAGDTKGPNKPRRRR